MSSSQTNINQDSQQNPENSRRNFLKVAGVAGGGGVAALVLAACGSSSKTSTASTSTATTPMASSTSAAVTNDLGILNYALTLEYLESQFYSSVVSSGLLKGSELALAKDFGADENQHVVALSAAIKQLGGTPVTAPKGNFPLQNRLAVLKLAATVENLGASAYLGQAGNIQTTEVLEAALSIHTVEARHAAALNDLLGLDSTPNGAFAVPSTKTQVLQAVQPFIAA